MWSWSTNVTDRRTDRQTDGQTTCDRNTALCTKVHRAVKTSSPDTQSLSECYAATTCYTSEILSRDSKLSDMRARWGDKITPPWLKTRSTAELAKCSKCWMNQLFESRFVSVPESQAFLIIVHVEVFVKLRQGIPSRWPRWRLSCRVTWQKLRLLCRRWWCCGTICRLGTFITVVNVKQLIRFIDMFVLATSTFLQVPVPVPVPVPYQQSKYQYKY